MHEMAITHELVELVLARTDGARVRRIVLEIGALSAVLPDAVRFCFELCTADTALAGATLDIRQLPGRARCRACGGEVALDRPFGQCACGSSDLDWLSGEELSVKEVEVD